MKKVCVTSVVSLLLVFLLVFAGCEQPVTAGLNNGGSVAVEETGAAVEGETGDGTTETGSGVVSVEVDTGDDDVIVSVEVVEPDDPPVVIVDPALELRIVDLDGRDERW